MAREGQSSNIRRFFASRLFLFVAFCVAALFALGYARAYYQHYKVEQQIAALKEDVNKLEYKKLQSLDVLKYVMSPNYVEEKARTELNMQKPGEHAIMLNDNTDITVKNTGQKGASGQTMGNPLKWWYYFMHQKSQS